MSARKSRKSPKASGHAALPVLPFMLLCALVALTLLRLSVALSGSLNQSEALLYVCAAHPEGGYIEGPSGVPLLIAFERIFTGPGMGMRGGMGIGPLRWISSLALLILSWCVWWISRRISPRRQGLALWAVLAFNLLPQVTVGSLVMDGAIVKATAILLALVTGWQAAKCSGKGALRSWSLFGILLGVATFFYYAVGWLLPVALAARFYLHGATSFPWKGSLLALGFLMLGWVVPLSWNARHDWIQWSSVAPAFDALHVGNFTMSLGLVLALSALLTPLVVLLAYSAVWLRWIISATGLTAAGLSGLLLLSPSLIPDGFPSPLGVGGVQSLATTVSSLRDGRLDANGGKPILIASTSGLAALMGSMISIDYPERPGAPSVFVAESPSLNSSFALWPGYADAVAAGVKDPLYTEEKSVSPFLGRNALYITTESREELPQTITAAFNAVALLKEVPITMNGKEQVIRIYQCEAYRTLSL